MVDFQFKLLNHEELKAFKGKPYKAWKTAMNTTMAKFLLEVKYNSNKHIRTLPTKDWREIRRVPSLPNKLTHRTLVLRDAISEGKTRGLSGWKGFTTNRTATKKEVHKTFFGKVVTGDKMYEGTWSPYVRDGSAALRRWISLRYSKKFNGRTMDEMVQMFKDEKQAGKRRTSPKEQITARINAERIGNRKYLTPSFQELLSNGRLNALAEEKFKAYVKDNFKFRNE
jgi:hypothetical protein